MIENIRINNYKSIERLDLSLGRVNVFIGENGAGKSNILEAIALAGAAEARKLDNEFLSSRGIRVTAPELMRSAFKKSKTRQPIKISIDMVDSSTFDYVLTNDNKPYSSWVQHTNVTPHGSQAVLKDIADVIIKYMNSLESSEKRREFVKNFEKQLESALTDKDKLEKDAQSGEPLIPVNLKFISDPPIEFKATSNDIDDFVIYSPENSALRSFEREGQLEPLGINGEGLLKLLAVLKNEYPESFASVKKSLRMLSWFDDLTVIEDQSPARLGITDTFIDEQLSGFDQRSANEGFLYVAFYFALFSTMLTPRVFAIDNIDASLNPKLCQEMITRLVELSIENSKQVILTTHNPAVLDGINLRDDAQRLFIITRDKNGKTKARRFTKPLPSDHPARMSELFLRGAIGGLPKSF